MIPGSCGPCLTCDGPVPRGGGSVMFCKPACRDAWRDRRDARALRPKQRAWLLALAGYAEEPDGARARVTLRALGRRGLAELVGDDWRPTPRGLALAAAALAERRG